MILTSPFGWFLASLAIWRVVIFIRQDALIEGTRTRVVKFLNRKESFWRQKADYLIDCPWCLSIWLSAATVWFYSATIHELRWYSAIILWLSLAAAAPIYDQLADKL